MDEGCCWRAHGARCHTRAPSRPAGGVPGPPVHPFQVNEFYFNSWTPKISKTLVRTLELLLEGFDVIPIVAPADFIP